MFIKVGDFIISTDMISYIKLVGSGAKITLKTGTDINISNIPEAELQMALDKLFLRRKDLI